MVYRTNSTAYLWIHHRNFAVQTNDNMKSLASALRWLGWKLVPTSYSVSASAPSSAIRINLAHAPSCFVRIKDAYTI